MRDISPLRFPSPGCRPNARSGPPASLCLLAATRRLLRCCGLLWCCGLLAGSAASAAVPSVELIELRGAISPVLAAHVVEGLEAAARRNATLVVLRVDTPGGLVGATRHIVKAIIASEVPVVAYVAPGGARAASAGTFILYASHVAAMAPGTHAGAATPVALGSPPGADTRSAGGTADASRAKVVNDAVAYLRSLAALRGRNGEWAERAVREAASLDAESALQQKVVDMIATDLPDLLRQLDGRSVRWGAGERQLPLAGATIRVQPQGWQLRVLAVLSEPELALMLVMLGLAGLFIELTHPGLVLPGVAGAIALLLGMYALQMLPPDFAALALLALGIALLAAEFFVPSGLLGTGGAVAVVIAALLLTGDGASGGTLPRGAALVLTAVVAAGLVALAAFVRQGKLRAPVSGDTLLVGAEGVVIETTPEHTWALVQGEHWRVTGDTALSGGERVRVLARDGLTLKVTVVRNDEGEKP